MEKQEKDVSELHSIKDNIYLNIVNSIYDGVCIYDERGYPVYANAAHMRNLGFIADEFWTTDLYTMLKLDPPVISKTVTLDVLKTLQPTTGIVKYYRTGKSCLVSSMPIRMESGKIFVTSIIRDITELLELQQRVKDSESVQEGYRDRIRGLENIYNNPVIVRTKSKAMAEIYEKAARLADTITPVLLTGETGVGKDFLAKFLHSSSTLPGSFIKVNCAAIPDNLLESELFGYEAGAFTGASKRGKAGLIELADNGTLYLDEIADLPLALQVKLLGVLQDRQVVRLGGTKVREVNFRIVAATNADLEDKISRGEFRSDLYYRLNVINFHIPPLRERPEDIFPLATFFLNELNGQYSKRLFFSTESIRLLTDYSWPGNIRELKNTLERICVLAQDMSISKDILAKNLLFYHKEPAAGRSYHIKDPDCAGTLKEQVARFEQAVITDALSKHSTLAETAEALGIDISTLVRKKKRFIQP